MPRLTKTDAARQLGIARSTLYKLIDQGVISPTADGLIDSTELVRAAPFVDRLKERSRTSANVAEMDTQPRDERHFGPFADNDRGQPQTPVRERTQTSAVDRSQTSADMMVDLLREQLQQVQAAAQQEREAAQERERAYREHIAHLTLMLDQAYQQNQRLLEAPRLAPAPAHQASPDPVTSGQSDAAPRASRGAMRQRILALLRAHPAGLSPLQTRQPLGLTKDLANTMHAMWRDGLLRREERGRYRVAEE